MFESKQEVTEQVGLLVDLAADLSRGDVLTWEAIETALGSERHEAMYVILKFRKRLRSERRIVTRPIINVGLRFLTREEALIDRYRERKMLRQSTVLRHELNTIEPSELGLNARRLLMARKDRLKAERRMIRAGLREVRQSTKSKVNPIRKAPSSAQA